MATVSPHFPSERLNLIHPTLLLEASHLHAGDGGGGRACIWDQQGPYSRFSICRVGSDESATTSAAAPMSPILQKLRRVTQVGHLRRAAVKAPWENVDESVPRFFYPFKMMINISKTIYTYLHTHARTRTHAHTHIGSGLALVPVRAVLNIYPDSVFVFPVLLREGRRACGERLL